MTHQAEITGVLVPMEKGFPQASTAQPQALAGSQNCRLLRLGGKRSRSIGDQIRMASKHVLNLTFVSGSTHQSLNGNKRKAIL